MVLGAIERGAEGASLRALPKQGEGQLDPGSLVINRNNTGPDYDHDSCAGQCLDTCNDVCYTDDGDCLCQLRTTPRRLPWGGLALLLSSLLYASYKARRAHRP